jgi:hypothetical protein
MSRLCEESDGKLGTFLKRPLQGDWPYVWLDAAMPTVSCTMQWDTAGVRVRSEHAVKIAPICIAARLA